MEDIIHFLTPLPLREREMQAKLAGVRGSYEEINPISMTIIST